MEKHSVYFDGTTYFVESFDFQIGDDIVRIFTSSDLDECNAKCEQLNEELGYE